MKNRIYTLSKNDLKDLVKIDRIPLDLHPPLPDPGFTIDYLPCDAIEMSIYYFVTLPSWGDAKVAEESYHLSSPLLERVSSHTTASAAKGAIISLPTLDEIAASLLNPHLAKKSKGHSQAEGMNKADLTDFYVEIENSLERDEGTSTRAASTPTPRLGKILGAPPSIVVVSASGPSHVGTSAHASSSGRSLSLREYDQILEDDFGTASRGEEIDLTLFPLAPGPYQMSYPFIESFQCALLVSHGTKFSSRYTGLVTTRNRLQEKFDRKARELHSQKDDASEKVKELQTELTDAKLALEKDKYQGYKDDVDGLREEVTRFVGSSVQSLVQRLLSKFEVAAHKVSNFCVGAKADFDKALIEFPTTPFPYHGKIDAAAGGTLFEVTQVLPDKHIRSVTPIYVAQPIANENADQVPFEHDVDDSASNSWITLLVGMPISEGITASVPYARLNGISPFLVLGVVLWAHNTFGNSSTHTPDLNESLINWVPLSVMMEAGTLNRHRMLSKYLILLGASGRGPTMSIPHFQKGQAEVTKIMWFLAALVRSRIPDTSRSLISHCWYLAFCRRTHQISGPKYDFQYKTPSSMVLLRAISRIVRSSVASKFLFLIYSWIGVTQVLVASSIIALTSAIPTDRSLSSLISTLFVSPSHCTAASLLKASAFLFSSLGM
ncbi:hypothetical protein Tco_1093007 [Tanacetum coccineum]|uniref:Uncharacterized protein n=1 Tax=Tanacetum coccineum TaxID=301880 RepID=A0ABQ5ICS6_9ASTR